MKLKLEIEIGDIIYAMMDDMSFYDDENCDNIVSLSDIDDPVEQNKAFNKAIAKQVRDGIIEDIKKQYGVSIDNASKESINKEVKRILEQNIESHVSKKIETFLQTNRLFIKSKSNWKEEFEEISTDDYITKLIDNAINNTKVDKEGRPSTGYGSRTYLEYFASNYVDEIIKTKFKDEMRVQEKVIKKAIEEVASNLMKDRIGNNLEEVIRKVILEIDKG